MKKLSFFFVVAFLLMSVATGVAEELTWCGEVQELELVEPEMTMMEGICPVPEEKPACCAAFASQYQAQCYQFYTELAKEKCKQLLGQHCAWDTYCMQYNVNYFYACVQEEMYNGSATCYWAAQAQYQNCMSN